MGLGLCAALLAGAPMAQTDPTELDTALSGVLVDGGSAAPLLRCMALFRAIRLQPGDNMGIGADAARREADLAAVAVVVWQSETATADAQDAFDAIVPMVAAATELYLARIAGNLDATGSMFDPGLETDLTYCSTLHSEIAAQSDP